MKKLLHEPLLHFLLLGALIFAAYGLVRDRVQQEVHYREALALGLDRDDLIIRRRLQQKLEFVSEGNAAPAEPSDAQLEAHLQAHAAGFATEPRFSLGQVIFDPQRHAANLARDAARRDRTTAQQREATGKLNQALLRKYAVTIEAPRTVSDTLEPVAVR